MHVGQVRYWNGMSGSPFQIVSIEGNEVVIRYTHGGSNQRYPYASVLNGSTNGTAPRL